MRDLFSGMARQPREAPPSPEEQVNLAIRNVGLIGPFALSYWGVFYTLWKGYPAGAWACMIVGTVIWAGASCMLGLRRDWRRAAAISAMYILLDAWIWLMVIGVINLV